MAAVPQRKCVVDIGRSLYYVTLVYIIWL